MIDVKLKGLTFKNPLLAASGTFSKEQLGFYKDIPFGGVVLKTHTLQERSGNPGLRIMELPGGMMNSIGLANPGISELDISPFVSLDSLLIASVAILDESEIEKFTASIRQKEIGIVELNLSCPNIMGKPSLEDLSDIKPLLKSIRAAFTETTIWVKLSVFQVKQKNAELLEEIGFDGITAINTLPGIDVDIHNRSFKFKNKVAGLSGRFLLPVGLKAISDLRKWTNLPLLGCGGVFDHEDLIKYLMVGADLVQLGSGIFSSPKRAEMIIKGLREYLESSNIRHINELKGVLQ
ncbi:hypothetical protein KAJ26_00235 [bacterium]|nr:hypothetical protein [bacterium]